MENHMPAYATKENLKAFIKSKTPLYPGLVTTFFSYESKQPRIDFAIFYALHVTDFLRNERTKKCDFGGGPASTVGMGVSLAVEYFNIEDAYNNASVQKIEKDFRDFLEDGPAPIKTEPLPEPKVSVPNPMWAFVRTLAKVLGFLNGFMFLLRLVIPDPTLAIIQSIIKLVSDLAIAHPAEALATFASATAITHAVALKINPPKRWATKNPA
jgi:hypothetical protein